MAYRLHRAVVMTDSRRAECMEYERDLQLTQQCPSIFSSGPHSITKAAKAKLPGSSYSAVDDRLGLVTLERATYVSNDLALSPLLLILLVVRC